MRIGVADVRVVLDGRHAVFPGIGRFVVDLWAALRRLEPDAVAFTPRPGTVGWVGRLDDVLAGPTRRMRTGPFMPTEQIELPMALRAEDADVYHSPHFGMPFATRVPVVITVHDLFPYHDARHARSRFTRAYYRAVLPQAVRRADRVVAVSQYTFDDLSRTFGIGPDRLRLVRHGLDHERWRRPPDADIIAVQARYRLPDDYVLHVGAAKWHKNLDTVLRALDAGTPALVCAGPTPEEVAAHADLGTCRGTVRILGRVADDDLPALYAGASALVVPSLYEAVSFPALEAMAVGTPVIASAATALPETLGDTGILLDPYDVEAWRHSMTQIVADAGGRQRLVEAGFRRVAARDWTAAAEEYRQIYAELA